MAWNNRFHPARAVGRLAWGADKQYWRASAFAPRSASGFPQPRFPQGPITGIIGGAGRHPKTEQGQSRTGVSLSVQRAEGKGVERQFLGGGAAVLKPRWQAKALAPPRICAWR